MPQSKTPIRSAELSARANHRAHAEHVHIFSVPGRPGHYTTKSKSNPTERYSLVVSGRAVACSCAGFYYRKSCKHVEALLNRVARESRSTTAAAS